MPQLAPHISVVPGSGIRRIHEIALELGGAALDGVTMLAVGEPDVAVAAHIADAARRAWAADATNYTANGGIPALRRAIVAKLAERNGIRVETEQVWVTVGATQALHQAMTLVLAAGDEVLVPDPGYTTFTMNARMIDAVPVPYRLAPELDFQPDLDELERVVSERTRAIIVNSPSNPLGSVFDEPTLRALLDFARRHDLWVISDEVYEAFTYGAPHLSIAALDSDDRVFSVFSLSKTYAMTGARVGYLVTPPGLAATMRTVQEAAISCVAEPEQHAAVAAIEGPQRSVTDAAAHYAANLAATRALLDARGIRYLNPGGAFYLWIDVSHASGGDVAAWAERFLIEHRVAVAPGSAFGRTGEGWIRVCLASREEDLRRGLALLPAP
ncbi:pyridoxal phosphate-dependent aminotransferase [Galbitalea sp. SE-J8]|uniref:pyridoxal phosphate-dependent aminotransferase n=1 Tax=Galbitalea sp. SE-J8 TaxID=3054952 RepID=UPI00259C9F0C|nr:pyridoxal phosphate-dependent aminotransferase [Galbitalea sp. SE-J8]MDM4761809.1 pyridoxal phosphate-dependent aminotransferase [Galbitalea sp. SE-J8]